MRILLNVVIALQLALGMWWTVPLLKHDGDFSTLYVFVISAMAHGVFLLVAAWALWKHPDQRRRAAVVIALPFAIYCLPFLLKALFGGPLVGSRGRLALGLGAGAVALFGLLFPKKAFRLLPGGLVRSRAVNWLLILGLAAAWIFPIAVVAWLASSDTGSSSSGTAVAYAVILLSLYIVVVAAAALAMMLWAWIGLFGNRDNPSRTLHIAQLAMGSPSLVLGAITLSWLAAQQ